MQAKTLLVKAKDSDNRSSGPDFSPGYQTKFGNDDLSWHLLIVLAHALMLYSVLSQGESLFSLLPPLFLPKLDL